MWRLGTTKPQVSGQIRAATCNKVLVLGGNFGGLTDALAVQHELDGDVDVRVVSASDRFLFNPSLILADKMLPPRKNGLLIPGPQSRP